MFRFLKRRTLVVLLAGAPLVTVATCDESGSGARVVVNSTNDDLVDDVLEILFGEDDD